MNEVLAHRLVKKVQGYGIPKLIAKDIVATALEASNGKNIEMYINYAVDLVYGLGFTKKFAKWLEIVWQEHWNVL